MHAGVGMTTASTIISKEGKFGYSLLELIYNCLLQITEINGLENCVSLIHGQVPSDMHAPATMLTYA